MANRKNTKADLYKEAKTLAPNQRIDYRRSTNEQLREIIRRNTNTNTNSNTNTNNTNTNTVNKPNIITHVIPAHLLPVHEINQETLLLLLDFIELEFDFFTSQNDVRSFAYKISVLYGRTGVSTVFRRSPQDVLIEIKEKLIAIAERYKAEEYDILDISSIEFSLIDNLEASIKGAQKSFTTANEIWFMPDTATTSNCFWVSLATSFSWSKKPELLTDPTTRINHGKLMKFREHQGDVFPSDYPAIANHFLINLKIYNNLYECIYKAGNKYNTVEIMVSDNHAIPLIRKDQIKKLLPDFKIKEKEQTTTAAHTDDNRNQLKKIRAIKKASIQNHKIMAWDLETITHDQRLMVYCSGCAWLTKQNTSIKLHQIFTHENNLMEFMSFLNQQRFHGYTLYAHYGGKFDVILLLRDAVINNPEVQITKFLDLNSVVIGLTIKMSKATLYFKDSYRMFQSSLAKVAQDMCITNQKSTLDHKVITLDNYIGKKEQILAYHALDCKGLLECVIKMSDFSYQTFGINITDCMTSASFAKRIFKTNYLNNTNLYRLSAHLDGLLRSAYYGGRNECFVIGEIKTPVYYYDFTSLFPAVATSLLPSGKPKYFELKGFNIQQALQHADCGFICCHVLGSKSALKNQLPLHAVRSKSGKLIFPYIKTPTELTLSTAEIKAGIRLGYSYTPKWLVSFEKSKVLKDFMSDGFNNKAKYKADNPALSNMWKIIINSGYGFWGFNPMTKDSVKVAPANSSDWIKYAEHERLINIDHAQRYDFIRVKNTELGNDTNVAIAAYITSLARIKLHSLLQAIKDVGGEIYYCDTDSCITDIKFSDYPDLMKRFRSDGKGEALGSLKNEKGLTLNGEDLAFATVKIAGCKAYCLEDDAAFCHLKGYKNAEPEHITAIIGKGEVITQQQNMLHVNKNDFLRHADNFQIRVIQQQKKFKSFYDKGTLVDTGKGYFRVEPFEI